MRRVATVLATGALLAFGAAGFALAGGSHATTEAEGGHDEIAGTMGGGDMMPGSMEEMREMHKSHEHGHDFEAMEEMSAGQLLRLMALMSDIGIASPPMDAERGRALFTQKGCVACHSINGVGGNIGPELNADDMPKPMNAFEFAARMWRGARAMTALQEDMLGDVISLDGQDLADLIAFAHDEKEQAELTEDQIPQKFRDIIAAE